MVDKPLFLLSRAESSSKFQFGGLDEQLPIQAKRVAEIEQRVAGESMATERRVLSILQDQPHLSILQALMIVPEGIFFPRMCSSLDDRIVGSRNLHYPECYAIETLKMQWISQIISAAAWFESLGLAHGDLTPRNILLDRRDNVKLADFGESVGKENTRNPARPHTSRGCSSFGIIEVSSTLLGGPSILSIEILLPSSTDPRT